MVLGGHVGAPIGGDVLDPTLHAELNEILAEGRQARRALKGAQGQIRLANQLLARYDDRLTAFLARADEHTAKEAQHVEEAPAIA